MGDKAEHRLPGCSHSYADGETFNVLDHEDVSHWKLDLIDCGGHTVDHCAFVDDVNNLLFCGDTLFAMGCGRIFEGTPQQMYDSVERLRARCNEDTIMFCAHEYTLNNAKFAVSVEPSNADLQQRFKTVQIQRVNGEWTVPCKFEDELKTNPFLRCHSL